MSDSQMPYPSSDQPEPGRSRGGSEALPETLPRDVLPKQKADSQEPGRTETYLPQQLDRLASMLDEEPQKTLRLPPEQLQAPAAARPQPVDQADEGDESIEAYMARLLQRVNQGNAAAEASDVAEMMDQPEPAAAATDSTAEPQTSEEVTPARQPARPPEGRDELQNLRQLANQSAHDALRTYSCKKMIDRLQEHLILAVVAAVCSILLSLMASSASSFVFGVSVAGLLIAMFSAARYLLLVRQLGSTMDDSGQWETVSADR